MAPDVRVFVAVVAVELSVLVEKAVAEVVAKSVPAAPPLSQEVDQDVPGPVLVHNVDQSFMSRFSSAAAICGVADTL